VSSKLNVLRASIIPGALIIPAIGLRLPLT
jgi:hypothetical protein